MVKAILNVRVICVYIQLQAIIRRPQPTDTLMTKSEVPRCSRESGGVAPEAGM